MEALRFEAELTDEISNIRRIVAIIKARIKNLPAASNDAYEVYIDSIAHNLENFYMAVEEIFKDICAVTGEGLPEGERWHSILLKNMTKEIRDIRPAVISLKTFEKMDDYRKFRHLVRNIYTYNIIPEKVLVLARPSEKVFRGFEQNIKTFMKFILKAAS